MSSEKTNFIKDTLMIDERVNIDIPEIEGEMLRAVFLPYYIDPLSLELKVVLKRSIMPGAYARIGRKMGLSALYVELPEDDPLTIEQAFAQLGLNTKMENAIPFGGVMPSPIDSTLAFEMVVVNVEPLDLIDEERGIFFQKKGEYEIGVVEFKDIMEGIQNNIIQDIATRLLLNELYIMAVEEGQKNQDPNTMMTGNEGLIGGGSNLPNGYGEQTDTMKTSVVPDEILEANSKMDFGAIYSKASPKSDFKSVDSK